MDTTAADGANRPTVLVVGTRRTSLEVNGALIGAWQAGHRVALLAPTLPDVSPALLADVELVDLWDRPRALEAGLALGRRAGVRGVVTSMDTGVELAAALAQQLGLPGPSPEAAHRARNKHAMRAAVVAAGRADLVPRFAHVTDLDALRAAAAEIPGPAVLKPAGGNGSKGILQVDPGADLEALWALACAIASPSNDPVFGDYEGEHLYEERLGGSEHSVEGLVHDGRVQIAGITDKWVTPDHYLEVQEIHPTTLAAGIQEVVAELTRAVVGAIGLDACAFHLECRVLDDGTAKLLEIAARPAGGHIATHLVPMSTGVAFHADLVRVATGTAPLLRREDEPLFAGRRALQSRRAGRLAGVDGIDEVLRVWGVEHVIWEQPLGASVVLPPQKSLASHLMSVIARAPTSGEVEELLERTVAMLVPRVVDPAAPS